jgi:polysaccharide chain length determinant protein (PEP-CTERM system associated)
VTPKVQMILDQLAGAWRFRWHAIAAAAAAALVGWMIVFAMPDRYEATSQVLIDSRTALKPALQGLTADEDVSNQLTYVRQSLLMDAPLCKIALEANVLATCAADLEAAQSLLAALRAGIKLDVTSGDQNDPSNVTFKVAYRDTDRPRALRLVTVLTTTLEDEVLGGKRAGSQNAQQFLASQLDDAQKRLQTAEDKMEAFKQAHVGVLPADSMLPATGGGFFAQLQKEIEAADLAQTKVLAGQNRRATLENQLRVTAATATAPLTLSAAGTPTAIDTASQIVELQAHLDDLLLKYTEKHPDVIAARQQLSDLKKRRALEVQGAQRGEAGAVTTSGAASNPVYQSIQLQINQADVDIAEAQTELAQHQEKVHQLHQMLEKDPQMDTEYGQLSRDLEAAKAQYTGLQGNYDKSKLSQQADAAGSVRFRVVQPPTVSYQPVSPRRPLMLTAVLVLALIAGGALAYWLDQMQPVVGSAEALAQLVGVPVLVSVGSAFPARARVVARRERQLVGVAIGALLCALIVGQLLSSAGLRLSIPYFKHLVHTWVS